MSSVGSELIPVTPDRVAWWIKHVNEAGTFIVPFALRDDVAAHLADYAANQTDFSELPFIGEGSASTVRRAGQLALKIFKHGGAVMSGIRDFIAGQTLHLALESEQPSLDYNGQTFHFRAPEQLGAFFPNDGRPPVWIMQFIDGTIADPKTAIDQQIQAEIEKTIPPRQIRSEIYVSALASRGVEKGDIMLDDWGFSENLILAKSEPPTLYKIDVYSNWQKSRPA